MELSSSPFCNQHFHAAQDLSNFMPMAEFLEWDHSIWPLYSTAVLSCGNACCPISPQWKCQEICNLAPYSVGSWLKWHSWAPGGCFRKPRSLPNARNTINANLEFLSSYIRKMKASPSWRFRSLSPSCSFGRYHQISLRKISVNIRVIPVNIRVISPDITMSTHGYNLENANHIHLSMDFVYVSMLVDISSNIRSISVNIRVISLSGWYQDGQARLEARCEYFSPFLFSFYTL